MPNALYTPAKEQLLQGGIDAVAGDLRLILVDTGAYTFSAAHTYLSSIASGARISGPVALTGRSVSGGVLDAKTPIVFSGIAGGAPDVGAAALLMNTGLDTTSRLVGWVDTAYRLPLSRAGNDIEFRIDQGAFRLLKLGSQTVYGKTADQFLSAGLNLLTADVRAMLLKAGQYTFDVAHEFLSSVPGAARLTAGVALSGKAVTGGNFSASPVTWTAVTDGEQAGQVLFYVHTGVDATARLVCCNSSPTFPKPTNGNDFVATVGTIFSI